MNTKTRVGNTAADFQRGDSSPGRPAAVRPASTPQGPMLPGDGRTPQTPIVIHASNSMTGVPAEYDVLKTRYGVMEQDWTVDLRSLGRNEQGRTVETFRIRLKGGDKVDVHFDISGFHQL